MKIQYVQGDLMKTDCKFILHGCNARGKMNSGVAKAIRQNYPEAYERYIEKYQESGGLLTMGTVIAVKSNSKVILNAITQHNYGYDGKRYVSYDAIADAMSVIEKVGPSAVAMPQIGAGLGGGDWRVIESIIESELKTVIPIVYVFSG